LELEISPHSAQSVNVKMLKGAVVLAALLSALSFHSASAAAAVSPQQAKCQQECGKFYSLHTNMFDQINDSWSACVHGCEFYSRRAERDQEQPIDTLKNCNFSCDERYGPNGDVQPCEAGCGFGFNEATRPKPSFSPRIEAQPSSLGLPSLFNRINQAMPQLNKIMERAFSTNPFDNEEFNMPAMPSLASMPTLSFSMPRLPGGMFGRREDDNSDHLFDDIFSSVNSMMRSIPSLPRIERLNSMSPFSMFGGNGGGQGGKMTVINSGPGYTEEKHYNIMPDGKLVEVMEKSDEMHHANPLDQHFDEYDVEIFNPTAPQHEFINTEAEFIHPSDDIQSAAGDLVKSEEPEEAAVEEVEHNEVEDFGSVDGAEIAEPRIGEEETKASKEVENPFLSVIRNSIEESERLKEAFLTKYRNFKDAEYRDNNSCSSDHLRWSDWVACVHMRMGVPRWLTAATIAFGIIFSVWLCFVIPTAAPRQRISNLVMRVEKLSPPTDALKAKEAEANASKEPVIAIIKVDMPPSYTEVTPGSPAPSYKSDMAVPVPTIPGSPAPSYKSVDIPVVKTEDTLEPIHKKIDESNA